MFGLVTASQNRLGVRGVVLLPLDVWLHMRRWHQASYALAARGTNGAMRRTPRCPPGMVAVFGGMPRRAGAGPLGGLHLRHALKRPTWRYRDRLSKSTAQIAPPNRGSLKRPPNHWHSRTRGGAVHSITSRNETATKAGSRNISICLLI